MSKFARFFEFPAAKAFLWMMRESFAIIIYLFIFEIRKIYSQTWWWFSSLLHYFFYHFLLCQALNEISCMLDDCFHEKYWSTCLRIKALIYERIPLWHEKLIHFNYWFEMESGLSRLKNMEWKSSFAYFQQMRIFYEHAKS